MYGMIFTYVWGFDLHGDWDYVDAICKTIEEKDGEVYLVELEADLEKRLERNKTPHRLEHKPTKRDVARSERNLIQTTEKHRLNSFEGEIKRANYIRINNTNLTADEVAEIIKSRFSL
ncbi:hypothetical protein MU1_10070 [Paenibacillus glycanilyticus]|uniref:Shikimate kinase n=1 Tax=Paenibacillus glycanilyticus TaxID=126569 RepID=A0ABQ6GBM2_9BACL|nr:hypothetical protein [Paenibacillus glycanilyticus]GLX66663.1 hypothetical protein MU1_10070 [Paenibacillus glycanilyticus]